MRPRQRRLLFALLVAAPIGAVAVACTFPEVTFTEGSGEAGPDSPSASSSSGVLPTTDASEAGGDTGSIFLDDGGLGVDVAKREDASVIDAAGCDARCDCDDDGYLKEGCDAAAPGDTVTVKGIDDCDDLDKLVHPGQGYSDAVPRAGSPKPGDWDCDGVVTKGIKEDFQCVGLGAGICSADDPPKFKGAVGCGERGDILNCSTKAPLGCEESFREKATQLCK